MGYTSFPTISNFSSISSKWGASSISEVKSVPVFIQHSVLTDPPVNIEQILLYLNTKVMEFT
jgi:hypothetical protein